MTDIELHQISELMECKSYIEANRYLSKGWLLISTHLNDYGHPVERHQDTVYCLGWLRSNGESQYPDGKISEYESI